MLRKRAYFEALAYNLLPEQFRETKNAKAILEAAQMQQQLALDQNFSSAIRFDGRGAVLINCYNGVLRVTTEDTKLTKHDPEQLFTGCLPASWPTDGKKPKLFQKVLAEVLPETADQALLQWFAGYMFYPSCKNEVFLISHGGGGSGKSTISDALMEVIGGKPSRTVLSMAQSWKNICVRAMRSKNPSDSVLEHDAEAAGDAGRLVVLPPEFAVVVEVGRHPIRELDGKAGTEQGAVAA